MQYVRQTFACTGPQAVQLPDDGRRDATASASSDLPLSAAAGGTRQVCNQYAYPKSARKRHRAKDHGLIIRSYTKRGSALHVAVTSELPLARMSFQKRRMAWSQCRACQHQAWHTKWCSCYQVRHAQSQSVPLQCFVGKVQVHVVCSHAPGKL